MALFCIEQNIKAYDFSVDGIYYTIINANTKLESAQVTNAPDKYTGSIVIPDSIEYNGKKYRISISDYAFKNCDELDSISVGVTILSRENFGLSGVKYMKILSTVKNIDSYVFIGCDQLEEIDFAESPDTLFVTDVGYVPSSFSEYCKSLKKLSIGRQIIDISEDNYLQHELFTDLPNLQELYIGKYVKYIAQDGFKSSKSTIKKIYFNAQKVYTTTKEPFRNMSTESVTIGINVKYLPYGLFSNNDSLKYVTFYADSLEENGGSCFEGCTQLEAVYINDLSAWCRAEWGWSSILSANPLYYASYLFLNENIVTSLTIPADVDRIGSKAFSGCKSLENVVIPKTVTKIGSYAFAYSTIKKLTILGDIEELGSDILTNCHDLQEVFLLGTLPDYRAMGGVSKEAKVYAFTSEVEKIKKYWKGEIVAVGPMVTNTNQYLKALSFDVEKYCPEGFDMSVNRITIDGNDIELDEAGHYMITDLAPNTTYEIVIYYNVDGIERTYSYFLTTNSLYAGTSYDKVGQCYFTLEIYASSDETLRPSECGIIFNSKYYKAKDNKVRIDNLLPNTKYKYKAYAVYGGKTVVGNEASLTTLGTSPQIAIDESSATSLKCTGSKKIMDATLKEDYFIFIDKIYSGNSLSITGLEPSKNYNVTYVVNTEEGSSETKTITIKTSTLELATLQPKCVSPTCAIVAATTNISEEEVNVGFQWKKYDAPSSLAPKEGYASIYNGQLEGYIKNLQSDSYYNVRAFYKSEAGNYYYSDWVTFDPSDYSYFEPTVHTYEAVEVGMNSAKVKAYVMAGTEEVVEQGFEYWPSAIPGSKAVSVKAASQAENNVSTVLGTGQVMIVTLTDLQPNCAYTFRSFVKTASGTTYGEERSLITETDPTGIGNVEYDVPTKAITGYYDLEGRKYNEPQKGLNIIRYSDGSVRKLMTK